MSYTDESKPAELPEWKDITSYHRGDTERKPTAWEIKHDGLNVIVVYGHLHYPNAWSFHCRSLAIDTCPLPDAKTAEEAKEAALLLVIRTLGKLRSAAADVLSAL